MEELERFPAEQIKEWEDAERFWIQALRFYGFKLNNLCSGGGSGRTPSLETRLKIGASRIGFTHTQESKSKIAASSKARMTEEEKRLTGLRSLGRRHTDDTKKRMSLAKKGIPKPDHVKAALMAGSLKWKEDMGFVKRPKIFQRDKIALHLEKSGYKLDAQGLKFAKGVVASRSVIKVWGNCDDGRVLISYHTMTQLQRGLIVSNGIISPA